MIKKPKTEARTDNRLPASVLPGRVSHSSSGDRRVSIAKEIIKGMDMAA
jgi:hypothetical protein